jgi:phospholipid/cholesterol/gamma-HCH transport system permease protein
MTLHTGSLPADRGSRFGRLLAATGAYVMRWIEATLVFTAFTATVMAAALRRGSWRRPVRAVFRDSLHRVAVESAMTTIGTGIVLGFVLVAQVVYWLQTAGQSQLVGAIVERSLVREIAPVVVGFIIFGRAGTRILIDLGEARPKGWLRQLERQGIDPITLLVMPRMTAYAIGAFCLATILLVSTLVTGYLMASALGLVTFPIWQFGQNVMRAMALADFIVPPVKAVLIGALVALVCSATALTRATGASELQRLVARGFVRVALAILLVSAVFDLAV